MFGENRAEGFWRIVAALWAIVAAIVLQIVIIVAFIWGVVDVALQLLTNRDFLAADSSIARIVRGFIMWPAKLVSFAATGDGRMMWLPEY